MAFLPDESRSLPPPPLLNKGSVWLGFVGWLSALADNAFNQRPVLRAGAGERGESEGTGTERGARAGLAEGNSRGGLWGVWGH